MTTVEIKVEGLKELIAKFDQLPTEIQREFVTTMHQSLLALQENVPPYVPQVVPPEVYRRTMTLAGSIGSSPGGGKAGSPSIYSVTGSGKDVKGQFGTNLNYAPYVIDPDRQAYMHRPGYKGRRGWWTMDDVVKRARDKIERLWRAMVEDVTKALSR